MEEVSFGFLGTTMNMSPALWDPYLDAGQSDVALASSAARRFLAASSAAMPFPPIDVPTMCTLKVELAR